MSHRLRCVHPPKMIAPGGERSTRREVADNSPARTGVARCRTARMMPRLRPFVKSPTCRPLKPSRRAQMAAAAPGQPQSGWWPRPGRRPAWSQPAAGSESVSCIVLLPETSAACTPHRHECSPKARWQAWRAFLFGGLACVLMPVRGTSSVAASGILSPPCRCGGTWHGKKLLACHSESPIPPPRHMAWQETCQCHAEADSLTALDESAWQAEASVPGVPRRILPLRGLRRCGGALWAPRRESSRQPELCTAVRMTAARRARREFLGGPPCRRGGTGAARKPANVTLRPGPVTHLTSRVAQAEGSVAGEFLESGLAHKAC